MAKVIVIANQKGGVGKTTTAVALAVGLQHNPCTHREDETYLVCGER